MYSSTRALQSKADDFEADQRIDVQTEDDSVVINISPNHLDTDDEVGRHSTTPMEERPNLCHTVTKTRSVSESSGDELISNNITGTFPKSILRSQRNHNLSRSVSESSADEIGTAASSVDCHYDSIPDLNSELDCSSLKKTVRFNDVVSRQLFRYYHNSDCIDTFFFNNHVHRSTCLIFLDRTPVFLVSVKRTNVNYEIKGVLMNVE